MATDEDSTGAGFQISFEDIGSMVVEKADGDNQLPGAILVGRDRFSRIMFIQTPVRI
ncbi:MAG: hypothetical protein P9M08_02530 [Candidatus Erginobacter occultus]|nr:hypothetical protein [Candidatus Erginobacter occultus]